MKKTVRTTTEIKAAIEQIDAATRLTRSRAIGAEAEAATAEAEIVHIVTQHRGGEINIDNIAQHGACYLLVGEKLQKAANLRFLANLLEVSPEVIKARALLDPLFAELQEATARELTEQAEAAQAAQELADAREAALKELEGQIENHPAVKQAAAKLAPFRRLGELIE